VGRAVLGIVPDGVRPDTQEHTIVAEYSEIPEEDRKKAKAFFEQGRKVAASGNYDYAIEMYIQGLGIDTDDLAAHTELREISLKRKASGGKGLGFFEARKYSTSNKDDKLNLLNAERLLAYDPGNTDHMLTLAQNAHRAGFYDTVMWIGPILQKANADSKKPEFNKFIVLKDIYRNLAGDPSTPAPLRSELWKRATNACSLAVQLKPDDMDLARELKNLGAEQTMNKGGYSEGASFRHSMVDREGQEALLAQDKDYRDAGQMAKLVKDAEEQFKADPNEPGKMLKFVDALEKTEHADYENQAIELLTEWYEKTKQFRFRKRSGEITMKQWSRMERSQRQYLEENKTDAQAKKDYETFLKDKLLFELDEYRLWAENYPTDMSFRFNAAKRLFSLGQFDPEKWGEAIPLLQESTRDAKFRTPALILLGRAFYHSEFLDEAIDTLDGLIKEYQIKGDDNSKEMTYWSGRAHEDKGDVDAAIKLYSQIVRMEFNYKDVQKRIRELRARGPGNAQ